MLTTLFLPPRSCLISVPIGVCINRAPESEDIGHDEERGGELLIEVEGLAWSREDAVEVVSAANYQVVEVALTCTCWDEVTADDVLLHALQIIGLAKDGCLVEHAGGLLEGSCRHET